MVVVLGVLFYVFEYCDQFGVVILFCFRDCCVEVFCHKFHECSFSLFGFCSECSRVIVLKQCFLVRIGDQGDITMRGHR